MTVTPLPTGTISVTENSGVLNNEEICSGSPVTYTFSKTGYTSYEFFVGGISKQKTSSNIFTTTALAAGQQVTVIVTGTGCSQTFTAPNVTVVTSTCRCIERFHRSNTICVGSNATFTSEPLVATFELQF